MYKFKVGSQWMDGWIMIPYFVYIYIYSHVFSTLPPTVIT
jgi:hypothetical protein